MKQSKKNLKTKLSLFAGAAAIVALTPQAHAQSSDALIDKLLDKGILTANEAKDLREEADKNFNTAVQTKTGMPDWVTGYKINGSLRGRFEQFSGDNSAAIDRARYRYRLLAGMTVNMKDNLEAGFRLGSGDVKGSASAGNPLSQNSTITGNFSDKGIYIDAAYGKWTPINAGNWMLSATIGKMDNPFSFTPMVFDQDLTPEGAAVQGGYSFSDTQNLSFTGAAFVLDEVSGATHDPQMYGGQVAWNSKWTPKWSSSLGVGAFQIMSPEQLTTANVTEINQGNTRNSAGAPIYNFTPIIGDASITYTLDSFPFYAGAFPIKLGAEIMNNPGAAQNNNGYWAGITFGKSGTRKTWDLSYRYEYLESDAWYDQLADDDNVGYYLNAPTGGGSKGFVGGTNVKGHLIKFNYSFTDSFTFSTTCFINDLINQNLAAGVKAPNNADIHFMADLMWKF